MAKIQYEIVDNEKCANLHGRTYSIIDESRGVREKFWLKRFGKHSYYEPPMLSRILFKYNRNDVSCEDWGEVFFSKICNRVGVKCVPYFIAQLYSEDDNFIADGVMCGSYKKTNDETEYSIYDLQMKHNLGIPEYKEDGMNTVDGAIECIYEQFNDLPENEITILRNDLIKQAIMDFLLCQTDRHWLNTTVLLYESLGTPHIRKSDCYDNGCIAMLKRKQSAIEGMSREIGKAGKDSPYLKEKLESYCPMFGISTSLVELNPEKDFSNRNEKIRVKNPKESRETFLEEVSYEILTNPEIAVFFNHINNLMTEKHSKGLDIHNIALEIRRSGDEPPQCVEKMIQDILGHQFDILNEKVHRNLKILKEQDGM